MTGFLAVDVTTGTAETEDRYIREARIYTNQDSGLVCAIVSNVAEVPNWRRT